MIESPALGRKDLRAFALAFLVAAVTLSVQILVHRIVSAKLLNNCAFFVISLTIVIGSSPCVRGRDRCWHASSVPAPRVLVIGVGGGFDILTALRFEASEVTGVEINGATLDIVRDVYRDYCGAWSRHPRVRLIADEGRHFLSTHDGRYDVLQLSGVDSYSGTPGAARVLRELSVHGAGLRPLSVPPHRRRGPERHAPRAPLPARDAAGVGDGGRFLAALRRSITRRARHHADRATGSSRGCSSSARPSLRSKSRASVPGRRPTRS